MIVIREVKLFEQVVTAVLDTADEPPKILSIKKGPTTAHEWSCAEYHGNKTNQDVIKIPA